MTDSLDHARRQARHYSKETGLSISIIVDRDDFEPPEYLFLPTNQVQENLHETIEIVRVM